MKLQIDAVITYTIYSNCEDWEFLFVFWRTSGPSYRQWQRFIQRQSSVV